MGCMTSIIKYLMFLTNFLVFALGIMMMTFSILAYVDGSALRDLINLAGDVDDETGEVVISVFSTASILLITVSVFVVIVSFFGCCGAIKESKCMLTIYIILIGAFLAAFIAGAVLGKGQNADVIAKPLESTLKKYNPDGTTESEKALVQAWDTIQTEFKCCGVYSFEDWNTNNTHYPLNGPLVPESCCLDRDTVAEGEVEKCTKEPGNAQWADDLDGCYTNLIDLIKNNQDYILYGCIGIILVMALNMSAAFAVCCNAD